MFAVFFTCGVDPPHRGNCDTRFLRRTSTTVTCAVGRVPAPPRGMPNCTHPRLADPPPPLPPLATKPTAGRGPTGLTSGALSGNNPNPCATPSRSVGKPGSMLRSWLTTHETAYGSATHARLFRVVYSTAHMLGYHHVGDIHTPDGVLRMVQGRPGAERCTRYETSSTNTTQRCGP